MENKIRFRCRGCNKELSSIEGAFDCPCRKTNKISWNSPDITRKLLRKIIEAN